MMRVELVHPMLVHFPIALLVVGCVLKAVAFALRRSSLYPRLLFSSRLIIACGVLFAWAAVIAGEYAEDIVRPTLCQPEILNVHRALGYTTACLFTIGLLFDWPRVWLKKTRAHKLFTFLSSLCFLLGFGYIVATGVFGETLVYEQGAAVENQCHQRS
jgi:uncharacterized membrane protein